MTTANEFQAPHFAELNEGLYSSMVRQLEYQKNTISLLHLQLKRQDKGELQKILDEKDRLIASLERQNAMNNDPDLQDKIRELEAECEDLDSRLGKQVETNRKIEKRYNEKLNELNDEILKLKSDKAKIELHQMTGNDSLQQLKSEINSHISSQNHLKTELQLSRKQTELLKKENEQLQNSLRERKHSISEDEGPQKQALLKKISELEAENKNREESLEELSESVLTLNREKQSNESRFLLETETLKEKLSLLELELKDKEIRQSELQTQLKESKSETLPQADLEILETLLDTVQKAELFRTREQNDQAESLCQSLLALCERFGLQSFESLGQPYDSGKHHIIDVVYSTDLEHNIVFQERVKGFYNQSRVFKKASVILAKNPVICHSCGHAGNKNSRYCASCGTRLLLDSHDLKEPVFLNDEDNALAYLELGQAYLGKKEFQLAHDAFRKALTLNPTSVPAVFGIARVEESRGNYALSLETLSKLNGLTIADQSRREFEKRIENKIKIIDSLQLIV